MKRKLMAFAACTAAAALALTACGSGTSGANTSAPATTGTDTQTTQAAEPAPANTPGAATSLSAGTIMAPGWAHWSIGDPVQQDGKTVREWNDKKDGVLVLPGNDGKPAPVFAGGSNIGIPANSQHPTLAKNLMKIIFSAEYQQMLGKNGLGPANQKYVSSLGDDQFAKALIDSASNSKLTPAAPGWAAVEGQNILEEFFQKIKEGGDVATLAKEYDAKITPLLNTATADLSDVKPAKDDGKAGDITLWLVGTDTPDELRTYLKTTFEKENPGSTLTIQQQDWTGLVQKLTTALSDPKNCPDVVELGNTQSPTFTNVGAFLDISDMYQELGGSDLLQSFVDAGKAQGKNYTLPYYFGSRYVFYRVDVWNEAGIALPKTLDEFNAAVVQLTEKNPRNIKDFSGFFIGGQDWRNGISWIFANGGDLAKQGSDGKWESTLSDPNSVKGLEQLQVIDQKASKAPADAKDQSPWIYFNDTDEVPAEG